MAFRRYKRRRYSRSGRYRRRYGYKARTYGRKRYKTPFPRFLGNSTLLGKRGKFKPKFIKNEGRSLWLRGPGNVKWGKGQGGQIARYLPAVHKARGAGWVGPLAAALYGATYLPGLAAYHLRDAMGENERRKWEFKAMGSYLDNEKLMYHLMDQDKARGLKNAWNPPIHGHNMNVDVSPGMQDIYWDAYQKYITGTRQGHEFIKDVLNDPIESKYLIQTIWEKTHVPESNGQRPPDYNFNIEL